MSDIKLIGPNNQEEFNLKIDGEIDINIEKSMVLDSLSASSEQLVGSDITIQRRNYTIQGIIAGMDHEDYPDSYDDEIDSADPNPNHAYAYVLERVANDWGTRITGSAKIVWNRGGIGQEIHGVITGLSLKIVPSSENNKDHYSYTLEFAEIDFQY